MTPRAFLAKYGPVFGLIAAVLWLVLFVVAMAGDPTWRIGSMYLSDLGVRPAAWAFNTACFLAGLLLIPFAASVPFVLHRGPLTWLGAAFLLLAAVFLAAVGVFTEAYGQTHLIVSLGFFGSLILGWLASAYPMQKTAAFGRFGGVLNLVAVVISAASAVTLSVPATEAIVVLTAVGWGIIVGGVLLWRRPAESGAPKALAGT